MIDLPEPNRYRADTRRKDYVNLGAKHMEITSVSAESRLLSFRCPNSYYAYPKLQSAAPIPNRAFPTLDALWSRSIHHGRDVNIYKLHNVFLVKEGLVFDQNGRLFDITRTYHNDEEIVEGHENVIKAIIAKNFASFPKGILAKSRGCTNYGHFILEMLPRAWLAKTSLVLSDWPAIIDSTSPTIQKISHQALLLSGFSSELIIAVDQNPVFFEELIFVDGLTSHTQYLSPFVMQCLDAISADVPDGNIKALYASRWPAVTRDFEDEPAVAARLTKLGIAQVRTAEMSFVDQIAAFKGADLVIAVSGAALTNLAFCKPGTRVLCFSPCSAMEVLFWMISESRRLDYTEVRCTEIGPQLGGLPWDRLIRISPSEVERILEAGLKAIRNK